MYEAQLTHFQNQAGYGYKTCLEKSFGLIKFQIAWIPIEMAGFFPSKFAEQRDRTLMCQM